MSVLAWAFNLFLFGVIAFWATPVVAGAVCRGRQIDIEKDERDIEVTIPGGTQTLEVRSRRKEFELPWKTRSFEFTRPAQDTHINLDAYLEPITDFYFGLCMKMYHRALLVARSHGGWSLVATEYDTETGTEKASLGGERKDWADPGGHMSRLYKRPFGVTHEDSNVILTPQLMEMGEFLKQAEQNGQKEITVTDTESGQTQHLQLGAVPIPDTERLVRAKDGIYALMCAGAPGLVDTALTLTKKSQDPFSKGRAGELTMLLFAFLAGFGAMWFAGNNGGSGAIPKGETIGITILPIVEVLV